MNTYVELWDTESGNVLGDVATLEEGAGYLKTLVDEQGPSVLTGLFRLGDAEDAEPIAEDAPTKLVTEHRAPTPAAT